VKRTQTAPISSLIRRILVPVDANQTKLSDLRPILLMASHLGASVTLLHCYVAPPSFDFAAGDLAVAELSLHRWKVRSRLYQLTGQARKLLPKCSCRYVSGSPTTQILRQSQRLLADLIAVPLPLDLVRWCWLPEELLDELIRRASCPVLCVPASQGCVGRQIPNFSKHVGNQLSGRDLRTESDYAKPSSRPGF
jgi:nucleotide-binding universal stress UspA family protein